MDANEYRTNNFQIMMIGNTIEQLPLSEMIELQSRTQTIAPFLDPTLYRAKQKDFNIDVERTKILRTAQIALQKLRKETTLDKSGD